MVLAAALAPLLAPHPPLAHDLPNRLRPPWGFAAGDARHLLGTDDFGRDLLSRLLHGARYSLLVGFLSMGIALLGGGVLGAAAGFAGRLADVVLMRAVDVMLAFPAILLAIIIVALLGPSLGHAMLAVGVVGIPHVARLTRATVMAELARDYVLAARAAGAGAPRVLLRGILPNIAGPLAVQASLTFASAIVEAAGLSFLGLGAQPPLPEWGAMLNAGRPLLFRAWWVITFPGLAILLAGLAFNLLGDGLRDLLDPAGRR
ncbi:MAG: ABC transporter permease [Candidatus Tectomicrobia bacterium]|nr:ABC transporter permease [Candidatus Tectomicrobia bacterium]